MNAFDALIFDLDGTLLHTLPDLVIVTNKTLEAEDYPTHTEDKIRSYVGDGLRALLVRAAPSELDDGEIEHLLDRWEQIAVIHDNALTRPYPDIVTALNALHERGCKLGVLSNKLDHGVQQVMNARLPGLFDVIHGDSERYPRKPDPTGLLRTIEELETIPERTAYIGDSPSDMRTSRKAGTYAVGVSWGYHAVEDFAASGDDPDVMLDSALELVDLLDSADGVSS